MRNSVLKSVREYIWPSLLTVLFISLEVILECLLPFVTAALIGNLEDKVLNNVFIYGVILILIASFSLVFGMLNGYFGAKASCGFAKNLRHDLYQKIQEFSFNEIDTFSQSSLITRLTTDVQYVQQSYQMMIRIVVRVPLTLIFSIVMAFIINPDIAKIFLILLPVLLIIMFLLVFICLPTFRKLFKRYDKVNNSIQENLSGIRVVKNFVREEYEIKKFNASTESLMKDFIKVERIVALNNPIMNLFVNGAVIIVAFFGTKIIVNSDGVIMGTGDLQALINYGIQILMSVMMISMILVMLSMSIESIVRISQVLKTKCSIDSNPNGLQEIANGDIEFKNVSFKYKLDSENYALKDVNLKIHSGETIGILGNTGSSKTTLVQLISRLYDATEGEVLVSGHNVKDYNIKALRDEVAFVLQKNVLFSGTIAENLRWGKADATMEEIKEACKNSCSDTFINEMKDGYNTVLERGGTNVSGGQRQRLAIARALLKSPKIIIFDDSTSAVDTKTDAIIRSSLRKNIPNTTQIIISQRVSSISHADKIIILDDGKVQAFASHEELLKNNEYYKDTYSSQQKEGR